jgi:hypothetical protein
VDAIAFPGFLNRAPLIKMKWTSKELRHLALVELKREPGCWGVRDVRIYPDQYDLNGRWRLAIIDYGQADVAKANRAVIAVHDRLAQECDLLNAADHSTTAQAAE